MLQSRPNKGQKAKLRFDVSVSTCYIDPELAHFYGEELYDSR